jgi:hypothetical protein
MHPTPEDPAAAADATRALPNPATTVEQVVAGFGDGRLGDGSSCSTAFRTYLATQSAATLSRHANYCAVVSFTQREAVLADLVNEFGRRLGYDVDPAPYVVAGGPQPANGRWRRGNFELHVRATATDPPKVDLEQLFDVAKPQRGAPPVTKAARFAVVTARQDVSALRQRLEAHPQRPMLRFLNLDGLLRMVTIAEEVRGSGRTQYIRGILTPGEHTLRTLHTLPGAPRG